MYSMGSSNKYDGQRPGHRSNILLKLKFQGLTFCGPRDEKCVANQTMEDEICLVPCIGLYADIADDSLRETMQANDDSFERKVIEGTVDFV